MNQQPQKVRRLPAMRRVADQAPPAETSDAELVHRVSLGDTAALEALYTRYARVVYSFAMRIVMDPMLAEEVLQEVFVRTWRQADRFQRSRGNFASWLLSITHNLAIDEVRKRQRRPQKSDAVDVSDALFGLVDEATNVEEAAEAADLRIRIRTAMVTLPEAQRGIFVGGGGSVNVARLMGVARMVDMMLTGRVLSAEEAERYGVVNYVTESGGARAKAMELARIAACNAPLSNYAVINALPRIHDSGYDEGLFFESMIATLTQVTPDAQERLRAFLDKKAPRLAIPAERGGGA